MVHFEGDDLFVWQRQILRLEQEGKVTRTFRRLDPDRQMTVIEALLTDAAEHGPDAVNVKRVAARAQVAVGSLYQYFPRRDGMLDFAAQLSGRFFIESMEGYRSQLAALPLREGLHAYLAGGIEWGQAYSGFVMFYARAAYGGAPAFAETLVRPVSVAILALVRALLDAAVERGELRGDVDIEAATRLVLGLTTLLADVEMVPYLGNYYPFFDRQCPPERLREAAVDLVLRGIGGLPQHAADGLEES